MLSGGVGSIIMLAVAIRATKENVDQLKRMGFTFGSGNRLDFDENNFIGYTKEPGLNRPPGLYRVSNRPTIDYVNPIVVYFWKKELGMKV
jgi:hypothetical protein